MNKPSLTVTPDVQIDAFLSGYSEPVHTQALELRALLLANLPDIIEQIDLPARMIGYCYGQKYTELICVIIPSKKGLKLGFNRGTALPDPDGLLEGAGKISRYVQINAGDTIKTVPIKKLIKAGLQAYKQELKNKKGAA